MILSSFSVAGLLTVLVAGFACVLTALWRSPTATPKAPKSWKQYRFGFSVYALIFLAFDMEMIFMYPWAVVFAELGLAAFLDMLVFIALLAAGIAYAWGMGGLEWE